VSSLADLKPGMIGFGPIHGAAGALVSAGQLLLSEGFHVGRLDIRHVFVVTEAGQSYVSEMDQGYSPRAVEAMPSGAREVCIENRWTPEYAYVQLSEDYPGQAVDAAAIARAMVGTPYSFASYAALAAWRFGLKAKSLEAWIGRRKAKSVYIDLRPGADDGHAKVTSDCIHLPCEAICSVLADQAWSLTGKRIMQGVAHQCVTPGALAMTLLRMEGSKWIFP
jgi:hypothetical protein